MTLAVFKRWIAKLRACDMLAVHDDVLRSQRMRHLSAPDGETANLNIREIALVPRDIGRIKSDFIHLGSGHSRWLVRVYGRAFAVLPGASGAARCFLPGV